MCFVTTSAWYMTNHVSQSGEWVGNARDGGREAEGANHLYVGGSVKWVRSEYMVISPRYYDYFIFADWPEECYWVD
jgi:hypothetical protein